MKGRKKYLLYLFISLLSIVGIGLLVNAFSPADTLDLTIFKIPTVIFFFALLLLAIGGFFTFLLKSKRRGIFIGAFVCIFLLLQFLNINNIFYTVILIIILVLLEILFWKKQ